MDLTSIAICLNNIPMLNSSNFRSWQEDLMIVLGVMDLDLALRVVAPIINDNSTSVEKREKEKWEQSNCMCLMIMKKSIPEAFQDTISDKIKTAKEFLEDIEKKFVRNEKSGISTLLANLISMKYKGEGNIREYIMEMSNVASKLRALKLDISEDLLVHLALISLPAHFGQFKVSYNCQKETWSLNELISHCVQEEERLKQVQTESGHVDSTSKNIAIKKRKRSTTPMDNREATENTQKKPNKGKKNTDVKGTGCFFCGAVGHMKKHCQNYHAWRVKKGLVIGERWSNERSMNRMAGISTKVYHGETYLGEAEMFVPPWKDQTQNPNQNLPLGNSREIRISHLSPHSERCPPLAILQTISPFSVRFKLQAKSITTHPLLHRFYLSCFQEFKSAVLTGGDEELHLVAMPSKVEKVSCFWCCSLQQRGLYTSCMSMLNMRCLSIVFDLDETLIVANTMKSFDDKIDVLSRKIDAEVDPLRVSGMSAELKRYVEDKNLLKQFVDSDAVALEGSKVLTVQHEEVLSATQDQQRILRPVIRLPDKNVVLTRINPEIRDTSVFVRLRPAWEDLRSYLTAKGRKRFEVYVCTMAERDYALEMWRLLDPELRLISSKQLGDRVVCVKPGAKKSLQTVFQEGGCHPKMAMVIDDRLQVWDEKDQPRVHVVPPFAPYYAPQAETANAVPVLCVARNVACNVRGGFFREFDENLMRKIFEVYYENDVMDLPYSPDVSDYLLSDEYNGKDAPIPEGINGAEVDRRMNGLANHGDDRQMQPTTASFSPDDEVAANRSSTGNRNAQSEGGLHAGAAPSVCIAVLQEIGRRCEAKVDFRSTVKNLQFSVEVLFSSEKIGIGMGKTREEAQLQAAENALRNLASSYLSFVGPISGGLRNDLNKSSNGFLEDTTS